MTLINDEQMHTMMRQAALVRTARNCIGVNATNSEIINRMRRATDNRAEGEPWCVCFVQWCVREVDSYAAELNPTGPWAPQHLGLTESTQLLWNQAAPELRSNLPGPGLVAVWRLDKDPTKGHCGIVIGTGTDGMVVTVEGNTSMANATGGNSEAERNGNGVWMKRRPAGAIPGFTLMGMLSPWG